VLRIDQASAKRWTVASEMMGLAAAAVVIESRTNGQILAPSGN
jgi:hypothetical protein